MRLTSSIDNEVPGLASNHDRRDVGDILVGDRARANGIDVERTLSIDLADAGLSLLDDGLDRTGLDDVLQGQNCSLGPRLKGRG